MPRHLPYATDATSMGRSIGSFRVFARCRWCVEGLVCFGGLGRFGGLSDVVGRCCIFSGMVQRSLRERVLSAARENAGLPTPRESSREPALSFQRLEKRPVSGLGQAVSEPFGGFAVHQQEHHTVRAFS